MDASDGKKQHRERGESAPDRHEVIRARRRRFPGTQAAFAREELADAINTRLSRPQVTGRSIQKIELGEKVDPHVLAPVLIGLGLRATPSPEAPAEGEAPGFWCRSLRLAGGCSRPIFCAAPPGQEYLDKLSAPYVAQVEGMELVPGFLKLDAFSERFEHHGLGVDAEVLQAAWWTWNKAAARAAWGREFVEIGQKVSENQARRIVAQTALAALPQVAAALVLDGELRHAANLPTDGKSGLRVVGRIASARLGWLVRPVAAAASLAAGTRAAAIYLGYGDDEDDVRIARLSDGSPLTASAVARALRLQEETGVQVFS